MEQQDFENLSPEEKEQLKAEKTRKSRNRIFGLVVAICIILFGILIYEIVVLLTSKNTNQINALVNIFLCK